MEYVKIYRKCEKGQEAGGFLQISSPDGPTGYYTEKLIPLPEFVKKVMVEALIENTDWPDLSKYKK